jgi:hypothetical protein
MLTAVQLVEKYLAYGTLSWRYHVQGSITDGS